MHHNYLVVISSSKSLGNKIFVAITMKLYEVVYLDFEDL